MRLRQWAALAAVLGAMTVAGCSPAFVAGAGAVVATDLIIKEEGGDGLF